jgi:cytochrome P450
VQIILHTLLTAGGETTSSLVGNAVRLLPMTRNYNSVCVKDPR